MRAYPSRGRVELLPQSIGTCRRIRVAGKGQKEKKKEDDQIPATSEK